MQSDIDKESEYGRVHSYIEFILHPELLEAHTISTSLKRIVRPNEKQVSLKKTFSFLFPMQCQRLKDGSERFPGAFDLIRTFMSEASEQAAPIRQAVLIGLAVKVFHLMELSLDDIEKEIPLKLQRRLAYEIGRSETHKMIYFRWTIRLMINNPNYDMLLKDTQKDDAAQASETQSSPPVYAEDLLISEMLTHILHDNSKLLDQHYRAQVASEVFEFAFAFGKYSVCEQLLQPLMAPNDAQLINLLPTLSQERLKSFVSVLEALEVISPPSQDSHPQILVQMLINNMKLHPSDSVADELLQLLINDVDRNLIGFSVRDSLLSLMNGYSTNVAAKCAALHLATAWCNSAGSFRNLVSVATPIWTGLWASLADKNSDIDAALLLLASTMERVAVSLRSSMTKAKFDKLTTNFLRLALWGLPRYSITQFHLIFDKNAPSMRGILLKVVSEEFESEIMDIDDKNDLRIEIFDDRLLTTATHAHAPCIASTAINTLSSSNVSLRKALVRKRVAEFVSHGSVSDALSLAELCGESLDSFVTAAGAIQRQLSSPGYPDLSQFIQPLQNALLASRADYKATVNNAALITSILTEKSLLQLLGQIVSVSPFVSKVLGPFCDIPTICTTLRAPETPPSISAQHSSPAMQSLISSLETLVSAFRDLDISNWKPIIGSWRDSASLRSICCVLSHVMVFRQQLSEAPIDFVPARFGAELCDGLEAHKFTARLADSSVISRLDNEPLLRQVLSQCVKQLLELRPSDYMALIALGDEMYRSHKYAAALKLYLNAGCIESGFWTDVGMPDAFNFVLKRVIVCLKHTKAMVAAAILCQFVTPPDWTESMRLIQENLPMFFESTKLLQFFWELPLLEFLAHQFHIRDKPLLAQACVDLIGRPEMNEMANPNIRKKIIYAQKKHFLLLLSQEVELVANSVGLSPATTSFAASVSATLDSTKPLGLGKQM